ncbi:PRC and DUF2382 domain-containing protein [Actinoplanes sp. M2I2]|uniref:DUF2382 domain-containing protein n=1 Tax=Actinoplanes sp. M2I2 TaxID=1734444 RepID=UPI002020A814|nr:PRC and DUF2382 domain-containing protein [Actinoplanes sp. M2I2]
MITKDDLGGLSGIEVVDNAGVHVGPVDQIYVDPDSGDPLWVTVRTGTLSFQESFVPLTGARLAEGRLIVAVDRDRIAHAPIRQTDAPLGHDDADRLTAYYGLGRAGDDAMTRSEERLVAGTRREPTTKVRLRKYLVTEERQITVPVTREEVRLEEVPVTGDEPGDDPGEDASGAAPGVILHAQRPVVTTETVPVERVTLTKETVREEQVVTAPVRREQITLETEATDEPGRPG